MEDGTPAVTPYQRTSVPERIPPASAFQLVAIISLGYVAMGSYRRFAVVRERA